MKQYFYILYINLIFLLITTSTIAQEPISDYNFTLEEAKIYAINNSRTIKNAMLDIAKSKKKVWETTAIGLPNVSAKAEYQNIFKVEKMYFGGARFINNVSELTLEQIQQNIRMEPFSNPMPIGVKENVTIDLTITQLIFSGEYIVGLQASRTYKQYSVQQSEKIKHDINDNVSTSYYLVLILRENIKTLDASVDNLKKIVAEMEKILEVGFIEDTEVDQLKMAVQNVENTISDLKRRLDISEKLLKFQMGIDLNRSIGLEDNLNDIVDAINIELFVNDTLNLQENIDYQIMETQEKLQKLNLKREKSTVLPTMSAFFRHQWLAKEPEINFNPPNVLGVNLQIPIFASGSRHSKIKQEKLELEKMRNSKQQVADGLVLEYEQAKSELKSAFDKLNNEKESMQLAGKIYEKTKIKFKKGVSSSIDLTQVQNQYLESQSNYYNAILEMLNSKTKLEKIMTNTTHF